MIIRILNKLLGSFMRFLAPVVIDGIYGGFFKYREKKGKKLATGFFHNKLYFSYLYRYGAFIGEKTVFKGKPRLPHYLFGIFIANKCVIGANCVVVKDMPPNTTAVSASTHFIPHDTELNNTLLCLDNM